MNSNILFEVDIYLIILHKYLQFRILIFSSLLINSSKAQII